eukprot:403341003
MNGTIRIPNGNVQLTNQEQTFSYQSQRAQSQAISKLEKYPNLEQIDERYIFENKNEKGNQNLTLTQSKIPRQKTKNTMYRSKNFQQKTADPYHQAIGKLMQDYKLNNQTLIVSSQLALFSLNLIEWAPVSKQVNFDRLGFNFTQIANHFECHYEISRKHELFSNLKQIQEDMNENVFEITPLTFFIKINAEKPLQSMKQQLQQFKNVYYLLDEFKNDLETQKEIVLETSNLQIKSFNSKKKDLLNSGKNFTKDYQQTLKLFNGNKSDLIMPQCHIRGRNVWILKPTSMNRGEGYLRTSSSEYTTDKKSLDNDFVHLTNNAVQKNSPNYGDFEDGNQLSFGQFKQYLKDQNFAVDFETQILAKMKYYAALSIESVRRKLNPNKRKECFEIFGYDYIIDKDFNVWLIEANTNPCIEESSSILKLLIPRMLDDAFKLTIDRIFPETSVDSKTNGKLFISFQIGQQTQNYK